MCYDDHCQDHPTTTTVPVQSTTTTSIVAETSTSVAGTTTVPTAESTPSLPSTTVQSTIPSSTSPSTNVMVDQSVPNEGSVESTDASSQWSSTTEASTVSHTGNLPSTGFPTGEVSAVAAIAIVIGGICVRFQRSRG